VRLCIDYRPAVLGRGGIARATGELAAALARRPDVDVRLFGHSLSPARRRVRVPRGARLHRLPIPGRSLPALARVGLGADRLGGGASLVHWTDYIHPPAGRAPVVLTIHDLAFASDSSFHGADQTRILLDRTRAAAQRASAVVTPSAATAADVARHLPFVTPHVIPFGSDHGGPGDEAPPRAAPYFLMLGTIEPRKNHVRMLEAWRALGARRPALVVVGAPGWECDEAIRALRAAAADGVEWRPRADDREVRTLLRHAHALLYPSLLEGFGFPPLEAMALGVPTLCGDTPALRELAGDAALFVDPTDTEAITAGLRRVHGDQALREALRRAGPLRARDFSWDRCAEAHAALYRGVLDSRFHT